MDNEKRSRRKYELKRRADDMAETRRRITEAAVELHGTLGPSRTSMSSIARRAGVQRHTVYRHFPDEEALFLACSSHYFATRPWPDTDAWRAILDPRSRLAQALDELYAYYERTEQMLANAMRDATLSSAVRTTLVPLQSYLDEAVGILARGWPARGRRRRLLDAALRHVVDFRTWHSLTQSEGITRAEVAALAVAFVASAGSAET